jgi:CBS domain-containing membrane protein
MAALPDFARRYLVADATPLSPVERRRSALAGLLGILVFEALLYVMPLPAATKAVMGPLGATSVILFTLPHSPLAQPWSVAGGLMVPALLGYGCGLLVPQPFLAAAVALAVAIWAQAWLRCLHPPGGAMALALTAAAAQGTPAAAALAPVAANIAAILVAAFAVNNVVPHRRYPACTPAATADQQAQPAPSGVRHADLQAALAEFDAYLDISEEDLIQLFNLATRAAFRRHLALTCGEVMRPAPPAVDFSTDLNAVWDLMRSQRLTALSVVDRLGRVIGLVSLEDFLRYVAPDRGRPIGENVRRLLRPTPTSHTDKPEVVGQIMRETRDGLLVAATDDRLDRVADWLARGAQAAVPVADDTGRLVGIITQADLSAALFHHLALEKAQVEPA